MGRDGTGVKAATKTSIEITFMYRGVRCRERLKLKPTPTNLKRAENHRGAILDAIINGTFDYAVTFPDSPRVKLFSDYVGDVLLVKDYLNKWLNEQRPIVSSSTWNDYRKTVNNHLIPQFGKTRLSDLGIEHIRNWCSSLECGNKRIANLLSPLRIALTQAQQDGKIKSNPLHEWSYTKKEPPKEEEDVDPFIRDEQIAILGVLQGQGRNLVQFAFWSGLRTSELVALQWGDVDWIRSIVRVRRAQTQAAAEPETTKTKSGRRDVKLLRPAREALEAQKAHSLLHPSGRVFLNPRDNAPWEGDQAIRKTLWTHALKRAGVSYRYPYQTRHTYASMMLSAGESPMWVAQQMGHADWGMIRKTYGRWIPDAQPNAGQLAESIFGSAVRLPDAESNRGREGGA